MNTKTASIAEIDAALALLVAAGFGFEVVSDLPEPTRDRPMRRQAA